MSSSIRLGRIAGIEIGVNWSWVVVFALITWSLESAVFPSTNPGLSHAAYLAMAIVAAICFFVSLLMHELGHALQARRDHIRIEGITLWLFGGVAKLGGGLPSAGAEFRVAVAGPIVSLVLGGAFSFAAWLAPLPEGVDGVVAWLGYTNLILLVFNLVPALPLDGGRVLRSSLWQLWGDFRRATLAAVRVARVLAGLMIGAGIVLLVAQGTYSGLWLAFVGWFLLQAAAAESRMAHSTPPNVTVATVALQQNGAGYPVVVADRVVAYAAFRPAGGEAAGPLPRVEASDALVAAFQTVAAASETRGLVLDDGRLVGVVEFVQPASWSLLRMFPFRSERL